MLERANQNKAKAKADNALFIESNITKIGLPDLIADCIISNCVVNLVPEEEKQLVFNEMFRLLKPGGRVAMSDILLKKDLTPELKANVALYVGCVAGASKVQDYETYLQRAGFSGVRIADSNVDLNVYYGAKEENSVGGCCGEGSVQACCEKSPSCCNMEGTDLDHLSDLSMMDLNELAGSFRVYAVKA
ncbi:hypothetical protein LTR10_024407 [Elasticomyces elasticus]|uniref:Arsenite methyltransferase n=1 Tax=Exophiala sideris TaxID=1016849 RepID=A0ABR0IUZ0_9EURO|nr:hypothetical protein LTR10_024407 [Elasticomyces elasticus]KAK5020908.1 hypothetical protein LTS07_011373 [Exophiala sideris]KAK5023111.1 hypothetical protein LTR13_011342 [Exophiala sideris]KAK5048426.1 hypothetical protein LTR69_011388 [Exophiala sideris]KAK5176064.1 hypothetical protein LTR44_011369 [Eurotiomycetes sp. CCFEE 6388]